eukprot:1767116-Lingulodinium_polyedra.AAC.1
MCIRDSLLVSACASHDCQSGLNLGMAAFASDAEQGLQDLFIVIESFRNVSDLLYSHLRLWWFTIA